MNPTFFHGPYAPNFPSPSADLGALKTNIHIYNLLKRDGGVLPFAMPIDVRDVARALVAGLSGPTNVGRKRIFMSSEWFSWKEAVEYIAEVRPELKDRLSENAKKAGPAPPTSVDNTRAKEVLGIEVTPWKLWLIETVDDLIKLEKSWVAKGLTPP